MGVPATRPLNAKEAANSFAADFSPENIRYCCVQNNQYEKMGLPEHLYAAELHDSIGLSMIKGSSLALGLENVGHRTEAANEGVYQHDATRDVGSKKIGAANDFTMQLRA